MKGKNVEKNPSRTKDSPEEICFIKLKYGWYSMKAWIFGFST